MILQEGVVFFTSACAVLVRALGARRPFARQRRLAPRPARREEGRVEEVADVDVRKILCKVVERYPVTKWGNPINVLLQPILKVVILLFSMSTCISIVLLRLYVITCCCMLLWNDILTKSVIMYT